jgi:hypothetical protein
MVIAHSHSLREALAEILPVLRAFIRLDTASMMELVKEPDRGMTFKLPFTLFGIYVLLVIGYSAFVDHDNIPAYEVLIVTLVLNWIVVAAVVLGPFAIALRWVVGKDHLPHLITTALCIQIIAIGLLFAASLWASWPQHVRSDLYLLGRGQAEGTAIHDFVCGGLQRQAKWVSLNERTLGELRANSVRLRQEITAPPEPDFNKIIENAENGLDETEKSYDQAHKMLNEGLALTAGDSKAQERMYREYPSIIQALYGFAAMTAVLILWFVIHMYKTFRECSHAMRQIPRLMRACTAALIASASLSWMLYDAQQTRMPDMNFELGPDFIAQMNQSLREMEDFGVKQKHALQERKARLSRYCPKASA